MSTLICPECRHALHTEGEPQEGQQITCTECGARLEVISVTPLEVDWFFYEPSYEQDEA